MLNRRRMCDFTRYAKRMRNSRAVQRHTSRAKEVELEQLVLVSDLPELKKKKTCQVEWCPPQDCVIVQLSW